MIKDILSYRGWKFWMSYDMHMYMLTLYYLLIVKGFYDLTKTLILLSSLGFYGLFGFLVNDYFDMTFDIKAGKRRSVHNIPRGAFVGIIVVVALVCMFHLIYLNNLLFNIIYILSFILAFFYSAPPLRFKSKGVVGIIVNCLIEKTLITFAIFCYFKYFNLNTIIFVLASFFLHFTDIMTHQIYDYQLDLKTNVKTFVVTIGIDRAINIYKKFICPLSLIFTVLLSIVICNAVPAVLMAVLAVFIIYLFAYIYILKGHIDRKEKVVPLYVSGSFFLIHNILPLSLSLILALNYYPYVCLLVISIISQYYTIKYKIIKPLRDRVIPHVDVFN